MNKLLKDVFTDTGIFRELQSRHPEKYAKFFGVMDAQKHDNFVVATYGEKYAANMFEVLSPENGLSIIFDTCLPSWENTFDALTTEYDITEGYHVTETKTGTVDTERAQEATKTDAVKAFDSTNFEDGERTTDSHAGTTVDTYNTQIERKGNISGDMPDKIKKVLSLRNIRFMDIFVNDIIKRSTLSIY